MPMPGAMVAPTDKLGTTMVPLPVMVPPVWVASPVMVSVWPLRFSVLLPVSFISRPAIVGSTSRVGWFGGPATSSPTVSVGRGVLAVQLPPFDQLPLLTPSQLLFGVWAAASDIQAAATKHANVNATARPRRVLSASIPKCISTFVRSVASHYG